MGRPTTARFPATPIGLCTNVGCAAIARTSSADADGGMCSVFHNQTEYDTLNYTEQQANSGLTEINLIGNLCYTVVAWHEKAGANGYVDMRTEAGWTGFECGVLPAGGAS